MVDDFKHRALRVLLHGPALAWYLRVWLWHLTPAAALLPAAVGFGWFFRYMTFWGYTLQTLALAACLLDDLTSPYEARSGTKKTSKKLAANRPALTVVSDDMACAAFAFAHVVTVMYHVISAATNGLVEGGEVLRPLWLNSSMHQLNSVVAWLDIIVSRPRPFSGRSRLGCCGLSAAYICWILVCREMNGRFPYPFLNALPFPSGFLGVAVAGVTVFAVFFQIGATANAGLCWVLGERGTRAPVKIKAKSQ